MPLSDATIKIVEYLAARDIRSDSYGGWRLFNLNHEKFYDIIEGYYE